MRESLVLLKNNGGVLPLDPKATVLVAGDGKKGDGPDHPDPLRCRMARLHGVGVDPETGDLYIGDSEAHKVRVVKAKK